MNSEIIAFYIGLKNDLDYWALKSPKMEGSIDDILIKDFFKVNPSDQSITINFRCFKHNHYLKLFGGPYEVARNNTDAFIFRTVKLVRDSIRRHKPYLRLTITIEIYDHLHCARLSKSFKVDRDYK